MITCKNCSAFASMVSIKFNRFTAEVGDMTIKPCKRCGGTLGDYDDFEELGIDEDAPVTNPPL